MSGTKHHGTEGLVGDSVDSSLDEPLVRGGTIDFSVDDGFSAAARDGGRRRLDGSTLILAGVVVASIAGLWSMRFLGTTSGQSTTLPGDVRRQVETWIEDAGRGGAVGGMEDLGILDDLDKERLVSLQVATEALGNPAPFIYDGEIPDTVVETTAVEPILNRNERLRTEFEETVTAIGTRMRVTAILAPDTPRAQTVLNGYRLMVGDVFDVPHEGAEYLFEVTRIGADGVWFRTELQDPSHEITIEVPVSRPGSR